MIAIKHKATTSFNIIEVFFGIRNPKQIFFFPMVRPITFRVIVEQAKPQALKGCHTAINQWSHTRIKKQLTLIDIEKKTCSV